MKNIAKTIAANLLVCVAVVAICGAGYLATAPRDTTTGFPTTLVTPSNYTKTVSSAQSFRDAVNAAQPGDLIEVGAGYFQHCSTISNARPLGSPPVVVIGQGSSTMLLPDLVVGSSDTLGFAPGAHDLVFKNMALTIDDRAGIKTVSGCGPNFTFENVTLAGSGWACDPNGWTDTSNCKWGVHGYDTAGWTETNVNVYNVFQEHSHYFHNVQGDHTFDHVNCCWAGRTAWQFVNRMSEGKIGVGKLTFRSCYVKDVCLEQGGGGYAFTFAGGCPTTDILIDGCNVQLGCDPALGIASRANITGCLVVSNPQESAPGKGDGAYPGGIHVMVVQNTTFEVGTVYPGSGSALRPTVYLDCPAAGYFFNNDTFKTTRSAPGQIAVALTVTDQAGPVHFAGTMTVTGQVKYRDDPPYVNWAAFEAAHAELFH